MADNSANVGCKPLTANIFLDESLVTRLHLGSGVPEGVVELGLALTLTNKPSVAHALFVLSIFKSESLLRAMYLDKAKLISHWQQRCNAY